MASCDLVKSKPFLIWTILDHIISITLLLQVQTNSVKSKTRYKESFPPARAGRGARIAASCRQVQPQWLPGAFYSRLEAAAWSPMRHNMQHIWPGLALMAATSSGGAWAEPTSTDTHGYKVQISSGRPAAGGRLHYNSSVHPFLTCVYVQLGCVSNPSGGSERQRGVLPPCPRPIQT